MIRSSATGSSPMNSRPPVTRLGERRVWRLCRDQRLWSTTTKKGRRHGKGRPGPAVHDDLVQRVFTADAPDRVWLTDITEHPTIEGKLYCCAIKDVFSNRIVGYSIAERMTAQLAVDSPALSGCSTGPRTQRAARDVHGDRLVGCAQLSGHFSAAVEARLDHGSQHATSLPAGPMTASRSHSVHARPNDACSLLREAARLVARPSIAQGR